MPRQGLLLDVYVPGFLFCWLPKHVVMDGPLLRRSLKRIAFCRRIIIGKMQSPMVRTALRAITAKKGNAAEKIVLPKLWVVKMFGEADCHEPHHGTAGHYDNRDRRVLGREDGAEEKCVLEGAQDPGGDSDEGVRQGRERGAARGVHVQDSGEAGRPSRQTTFLRSTGHVQCHEGLTDRAGFPGGCPAEELAVSDEGVFPAASCRRALFHD